MRYLGGKTRIAKQIATVIDSVREPGRWVWDPFCGGLSVSVALSAKGPVLASDISPALIALYQAVRNGWTIETELSREEYERAKALPDSDPRKAFAGFGCSFGGKWFGGYAAPFPTNRTPHGAALRALQRDCPVLAGVACVNFLDVEPDPEPILYLDPPYAGTTSYAAVGSFDREAFIDRVRAWSAQTHVFVSEYAFPIGEVVWQSSERTTLGGKGAHGAATERLYYLGPNS